MILKKNCKFAARNVWLLCGLRVKATVIKVPPTCGASVFQRNTRIALCIAATIIRILLDIDLNSIVGDACLLYTSPSPRD